jgi:uncharacterized membrane protein YqiK
LENHTVTIAPALIPVIVAVGVLVGLIVLFKMAWRVAEPNEALIVTGLTRGHDKTATSEDGPRFKIVVGRGTLVLPGAQTVRRLSLALQGTNLKVECVSSQGLPVEVRGVVVFKVADDIASIANATRRFLDQQDQMTGTIHELFAGHLRSIVGGLTIEEMLHNRERLTSEVRSSLANDMQVLGLTVDSLQIQEIHDSSDYIVNLGRPHAAAVASAARIAEAERDQEATEREQRAAANKAEYTRDSQIKQAAARAQVEAEQAKAAQAGPLAEAIASQEVVEAETRTSELKAALAEKDLESTVRKPADAAAYAKTVEAEADKTARIFAAEAAKSETELRAEADATRVRTEAEAAATATERTASADAKAVEVKGLAEATATQKVGEAEAAAAQAKGLAEAKAIEARAEALKINQQAVIQQVVAESLPQIVEAAASSFRGMDNVVLMDGPQSIGKILTEVMTTGGMAWGLAKDLMASVSDGTVDVGAGSVPARPSVSVDAVNSADV